MSDKNTRSLYLNPHLYAVIYNPLVFTIHYPYNAPVAGVAQSVEQHIRNVWVGGSIPPIGFIFQ